MYVEELPTKTAALIREKNLKKATKERIEAIILSVIGGIIGLLMVWIIALLLTKTLDFEFVLGTGNILLGTGLAALIGLISGILPAISASKLDPVEAIRTGM